MRVPSPRRSAAPKARIALAASALLALGGCGSLAIQEDATARIDAALQAYSSSVLAMDANRIAASYTAGGELQIPGREPLKGPDAIRAFFGSLSGVTLEENELKSATLQVVGPGALQTGTFRQKARLADGKVVETKGTFEAEWERQRDGSWRLARMTTNPPPLDFVRQGETP